MDAWKKTGKEAHNFTKAVNRRAKKYGAKGRLHYSTWLSILDRYNHACAVCGAGHSEAKLTPDHIEDMSKGGSNLPENIQVLCVNCNNTKNHRYQSATA